MTVVALVFGIASPAISATPAGAAPTQTVTITLKPTTVAIGHTAHVTGTVSPSAAGKIVRGCPDSR